MSVFVSYSSRDSEAVSELRRDIELGGHSAWSDDKLVGGEEWWQQILVQIQHCSVFVFSLSQNSIRSKPCRAELDYAWKLGIPVIPVQVGRLDNQFVPTPISKLKIIDYRNRTSTIGVELISSIERQAARRGPLPHPLPDPPPMPFADLLELGRRIDDPGLRSAEQLVVISNLRLALRDEDDQVRARAQDLLRRLRLHPECTYANVSEIDAILNGTGTDHPAGYNVGSGAATGKRRRRANRGDSGGATSSKPVPTPRQRAWRSAAMLSVLAALAAAAAGFWYLGPDQNAAPAGQSRPPAVIGTISLGRNSTYGVAVAPQGRHACVANGSTGSLPVIDTTNGTVRHTISIGDRPRGIAVSPDGRRVYVTHVGAVSVIDSGLG